MAPTVHTADEAAVILKCTASWLKEQARKREIPFTMVGSGYRWTDAHLEEIVRLREHIPGAPAARQPAVTPRAAGRPPAVAAGNAVVPLLRARQPRRRAQAGAA